MTDLGHLSRQHGAAAALTRTGQVITAPAPPAAPADPLTVLLAFVDPLDRIGAITQIAAP